MKRDERIYGCEFCSFFSGTKHPDILKLKLEWIKFGKKGKKKEKAVVFKSKKEGFSASGEGNMFSGSREPGPEGGNV